jgi:hypothetical protein
MITPKQRAEQQRSILRAKRVLQVEAKRAEEIAAAIEIAKTSDDHEVVANAAKLADADTKAVLVEKITQLKDAEKDADKKEQISKSLELLSAK